MTNEQSLAMSTQVDDEARIAEINLMIGSIKDHPDGRYGANHWAQLKIQEEACMDLYRAGWRKQEVFGPPPESGHAIPKWLRDQFDGIEMEVRKLSAEGVFTQMRTKVQAYFEMLRSVERSKAGKELFVISQQNQLIASLRESLQEAIEIDCQDDVIDACAEVERTGTPGGVIREMNDEIVTLRTDAERFQFIAQDAESSLERIYGDDWLSVVDCLRGMGKDDEP